MVTYKLENRIWAIFIFLWVSAVTSAQNNLSSWPDIPLLEITTDGGVEPTVTRLETPEGCMGSGIISEHVPGRLVITLKGGEILYDSGDYEKGKSGIRIKVRGNSTGAFLEQKPYKVKLSKKADLIGFDKSLKSKDWALISISVWNPTLRYHESNIQHAVGLALCHILDFPWEPRNRFVNVVLNGKYRGLYNLSETVERADNRVKTSAYGFLIENDAYWWKEGEVWFKTDRQHPGMGYTFKYPDPDDITDEQKDAVASYMQDVENAIFSQDHIGDYIDYESFARWILAHDILGSYDAAGSNTYLYKESLDPVDHSASKLKMATLWDFDTCFRMDDSQWSMEHTHSVFFYPQLFKDGEFVDEYKRLYVRYKDVVYPSMKKFLEDLRVSEGSAFEESRRLHQQVYDSEMKNSLDEQIDDILTHLKARLEALDDMVGKLQGTETGITTDRVEAVKLIMRTDLYGRDFTQVPSSDLLPNIYVEKYSDGSVRKLVAK